MGLVAVKPYQIIVIVALAVREQIDIDGGLSHFPAILDTGMNHNFCDSRAAASGLGADLSGGAATLRHGLRKTGTAD
jgi:hypothetical protein